MKLRALLKLTKPKLTLFNILTAITGYLASTSKYSLNTVGWISLVGFFTAGGSCVLNNYLDRDLDSLMRRTKKRPIPSGEVSPNVAFYLGTGFVCLGLLTSILTLGPLSTLFAITGVIIYVVVYSLLLKRRTWWNILIGGLAGSCPPLVGSAVTGGITPTALFLSLLIFLWTPTHFWTLAMRYVNDYKAAGVPMLPVKVGLQRTARTIVISDVIIMGVVLLGIFLRKSSIYVALAIPSTTALLIYGGILLKKYGDPKIALQAFKLSNHWLLVILIAILLS